jgi:putative spermidine/putrescine transport system permease protein
MLGRGQVAVLAVTIHEQMVVLVIGRQVRGRDGADRRHAHRAPALRPVPAPPFAPLRKHGMNPTQILTGERALKAYVLLILLFLALPIVIVVPLAFSTMSRSPFRRMASRCAGSAISCATGIRLGLPQQRDDRCISTAIAMVIGISRRSLRALPVSRRETLLLLFMTPLIFPAIVFGAAMALMLSRSGCCAAYGPGARPYSADLPIHTEDLARDAVRDRQVAARGGLHTRANRWQTFRYVSFRCSPGLLAGATFSLIISFDEFTVSMFWSGPADDAAARMYNYSEFSLDPTIAAISTVLLVITSIAILIIEKLVGLGKQFS